MGKGLNVSEDKMLLYKVNIIKYDYLYNIKFIII